MITGVLYGTIDINQFHEKTVFMMIINSLRITMGTGDFIQYQLIPIKTVLSIVV